MSVAMSIQFSRQVSERDLEEVQISDIESLYESAYSVSSLAVGGRYTLLPLDREKKEIRLLQLLPGKPADPIICKLYLASRNDGPIYKALSYTWGKPLLMDSIVVNDRNWLVTENLHQALLGIRDEHEPLTLWIDAICIDQRNDEEKSWHVQQMRQTFAEAHSVIVWLGAAPDEDMTVPMLREMGERASSLGTEETIWGSGNGDRIVSLYTRHSIYRIDTPQSTPDEITDPLEILCKDIVTKNPHGLHFPNPGAHRFFSQPWWGRTWITFAYGQDRISQEALCIAALLYYHYCQSDWSAAESGMVQADAYDPDSAEAASTQQRFTDMITTETDLTLGCVYNQFIMRWSFLNYASTTGLPLAFLISSIFTYGDTRTLKASDPRDYVFGLIGLATDTASLGIIADYSHNTDRVFTTLAKALIKQGNYIVLSWCRTRGARQNLPSWVPDLSRKIHRPMQWICRNNTTGTFSPETRFEASKGLETPPNVFEEVYPLSRILRLHGISIDTIAHSGVSFDELFKRTISEPKIVTRTCIRWLKELKAFLTDSPTRNRYGDMAGQMRAVWHTSVMDIEMSPSWSQDRMTTALTDFQKELYADNFPYDRMMHEPRLREHFRVMDMINTARRPWISSTGWLGLGPAELMPGDKIVIFGGAQLPHILRTVDDHTQLIGDTYIHELMDGEAARLELQPELFQIN